MFSYVIGTEIKSHNLTHKCVTTVLMSSKPVQHFLEFFLFYYISQYLIIFSEKYLGMFVNVWIIIFPVTYIFFKAF